MPRENKEGLNARANAMNPNSPAHDPSADGTSHGDTARQSHKVAARVSQNIQKSVEGQ